MIVIHASFGQGHKKAAQAIGESLGVEVFDLLDFTYPAIKFSYIKSYLFITRYFPFLWKAMVYCGRFHGLMIITHRLQAFLFTALENYLVSFRPKVVIVTHFSVAKLIVKLKNRIGFKIICVITDLRVHPLWVTCGIDKYIAALKITRDDLAGLGVGREMVLEGFAPLRKGFVQCSGRKRLLEAFGLEDRPSVLFISSLEKGISAFEEAAKHLISDYNLLVICAQSRRIRAYLESLNSPRIRIFNFYEKIWELMELSQVIITKPGGLTVFEGLYKKRYFVFTDFIPGQEKDNMDVLVSSGVGRFVCTAAGLIKAVDDFTAMEKAAHPYPFSLQEAGGLLRDLCESFNKETAR